jgi:hypothetical protein
MARRLFRRADVLMTYGDVEMISIFRAVGTLALVTLSAAAMANPAKFYSDDPILVEPETQDASRVSPWKIDLLYDLMLNQFTRPGIPPGTRARNINTIDEVPDSNWFTNRILARPMSIEEAVRGPSTTDGPAPGRLTIIRAKTEGAAPGFTMRDTAGIVWFVEFDPKSNPEASSGAAVIANRIFWALGYQQAEYHLGELTLERLEVDREAIIDPPSGKPRQMTIHDIKPILARAARNPNGSYRILASRLLPGKLLGGFKYYGTRPDDPNDIIPHEQRRELRALQVFAAWTNLVDIKALNTMDSLITENGRSRVRHYLLDIGSGFGIGANGPHDWTDGYEHLYEKDKTLKRMATLGFYLQPWQTVKYEKNRSVGHFEGDQFDPLAWRSRTPAAALLQATDDDTFWAARRVTAFSDGMIHALVKTGKYSDPGSERLLTEVLIKRRDKIGRTYMTRINPLVNFSLNASGVLTFENAAVKAGVAHPPARYSEAWFRFNNVTGASTPIGETAGPAERIDAPAGLDQTVGSYVVAEVRAPDSEYLPWTRPVRATFHRLNSGWKLVGLDRLPVTAAAEQVGAPVQRRASR